MSIQDRVKFLLGKGLTQGDIAVNVGTNQSTIQRIKEGSEPKYELGCRIERLYKLHMQALIGD